MKHYAAAYVGVLSAMAVLDLLWLGWIAKPLYTQGIGHLMAPRPNLVAAVTFYLLYALGLMLFAVVPHAAGAGWLKTLGTAALFGFFAYATYDLTNLATLRDWSPRLALIDMAWGTALSGLSAVAGRLAMDWAAKP